MFCIVTVVRVHDLNCGSGTYKCFYCDSGTRTCFVL